MSTLAELQAELAEVKTALSNIRKAGQSYVLNAGAGGTSRTVTMAEYKELLAHKRDLETRIEGKNNTRASILRSNW